MSKSEIKEWVAELDRPTADETCYTVRGNADRLGALRKLRARVEAGEIASPKRYGVNLHVHTNKSFSLFASPSAAVWRAFNQGLEVFGVNDHYTIAAHAEFRQACGILGIAATFCIEAVAIDREAQAKGWRTNDPVNPGRTYLCGQGVRHDLDPNGQGARQLAGVREAIERRHRMMVEKVAQWLDDVGFGSEGFTWESVVGLTPHGNVIERHIAQRTAEWLAARFPSEAERTEQIREAIGGPPPGFEPAPFQNWLRNQLLKVGKPGYEEESPEAFLSLEDLRDLYLEYGAVPIYPVLGNPVTETEEDVGGLIDGLRDRGIPALEAIPYRNTKERLAEIVATAKARGVPIFTGTEHNTKDDKPLLDPLSGDPDFYPFFRDCADRLLAHQSGKPMT